MTMQDLQQLGDNIMKRTNELAELMGLRGFTHICPVCNGDKEIHPSMKRPEVSFVCPCCKGLGMVKE